MDHQDRQWTFLTNHARVLLALVQDPAARLRTVAAACQITERTVHAIVGDLERAGYLRRTRVGRRNRYRIDLDRPLGHLTEASFTLRALVESTQERHPGEGVKDP